MSESGGNPNASNGQYYGIGEMPESYYIKYTGQTCIGNYDLQLEAMKDYIADRYGSIHSAWEHWKEYNWY